MYGVLVATATKAIQRGERLTPLNVHHRASAIHERSGGYHWSLPDVAPWKQRTFMGYHRSDGQVGTRNYWLVVPLVFCENRNIDVLKQAFEEELGYAVPQIYRRQVAHLAKLYRDGTAEGPETRVEGRRNIETTRARLFENGRC